MNALKPLMVIEELEILHSVYVVGSPGEAWFSRLNPCKMVPALEDFADDSNEHRIAIWESTSCLTFLADKYDHKSMLSGKNLHERSTIGNWMAHHTAALGYYAVPPVALTLNSLGDTS